MASGSSIRPGGPEIFEFFDLLEQNKVVKVKFTLVKKDGEWKGFRWEWGGRKFP